MILTLQWYIFREMGRTFLLTAVGLTLVFALGGGVFNMIRIEGVTAVQAAQLLGFVLPVATTLTLPVAVLFSAAITYGRLSADNELTACRSGGINIQVLLLPAIVLSLGVAGFTFYFSNFVIPHFIQGLDELVRKDLAKIVVQELETTGHLSFRKYRMHAEKISAVPPDEAEPGTKQFLITGAHIIELNGEELARYITAEQALLTFEEVEGVPQIRFDARGANMFDRLNNESFQAESQSFGPFPIQRSFDMKEKWLDLPALLRYRQKPQTLRDIQGQLARLRDGVLELVVWRAAYDAIQSGGTFTFGNDKVAYQLQAEGTRRNPETLDPTFQSPVLVQRMADHSLRVTADRAVLSIRPQYGDAPHTVQVLLEGNVKRVDSRQPGPILDERHEPPAVPVSAELTQRAADYRDDDLLAPETPLDLSHALLTRRESLASEVRGAARRITGILHARAAFSASVLLLVPLGAALGIIFRGAQPLSAFGVSFLPALFVTVTIIMGRQLTENESTEVLGVGVVWSGLVLLAVVDIVVTTKVVRR